MLPHIKSFFFYIGVLGIVVCAILFLARIHPLPAPQEAATTSAQTAAAATPVLETPESPVPSTPMSSPAKAKPAPQAPVQAADASDGTQVTRIENPYPFAQKSLSVVNEDARLALVNILCSARAGSLRPISGSGVLIDSRGVILTNAHVAQYVLLSQSPQVDLSCTIRGGYPARPLWKASVLYIPPLWVKEHAKDIKSEHPMGTGEHDYALLYVAATVDGTPLPASFPFLPIDTRDGIGFVDDTIVAASYPAEFLGGIAAQTELYPLSSVTTIKELLTFDAQTIDAISLGGIIAAQGGSSGGAVVNAWGRLIGIISTTSEGDTTAERDLRAITLSYISRDMAVQAKSDLTAFLGGNPAELASDFTAQEIPALIQLLFEGLKAPSQ